jgi:hypothetical protein
VCKEKELKGEKTGTDATERGYTKPNALARSTQKKDQTAESAQISVSLPARDTPRQEFAAFQ